MIDVINVNAAGKNKEELREELIRQLDEKLDKAFEEREEKQKEDKKEKPLMHVRMMAEETKDREGFDVRISIEGEYPELMTMLTMGTISALEAINEGEVENIDILSFITGLIHEVNDRQNQKRQEGDK